MKKIFYFIAILFLTYSCQEKEGTLFDFGGKNFASFDKAKYTFNAHSEGKEVVYLYHLTEGESSTFTITVNYNGADDLFSVSPTQITFSKDNNKVPVTISYDMSKLKMLDPYTITLSIPAQDYPGEGVIEKQDVVITLHPEWEFFAEGAFFSDIFTWWFEEDITWTKEIYRGLVEESLGFEVYNIPSLYTSGLDFYFIVDATTGEIRIPGVKPDENGFYLWSTGYLVSNAHGYFHCLLDPDPDYTWFDKETKTAVFSNFLFTSVSSIELGWFDEFFDWGEKEPFFDYSAEVEFTGRFTNTAGKDYAMADVKLGADVAYALVALITGDVDEAIEDGSIDDIIDGITDGSIESTELTATGSLSVLCSTSGLHSFIVVTFDDDDEAKEVAYTVFVFPPDNVNDIPKASFAEEVEIMKNGDFSIKPKSTSKSRLKKADAALLLR